MNARLREALRNINRRLQRVCTLLEEPQTVATPPPALDVNDYLSRIVRLQYARSLDELNHIHDSNVMAYVTGSVEMAKHDKLEAIFNLRHRDLLRDATKNVATTL